MAEAVLDESLASMLAGIGQAGWGVTVLFYAAVHLIQAYLVTVGSSPSSHAAREVAMHGDRALGVVERHYTILKKESEDARYDCRVFSQVEFESLRARYGRLQGHMQRLLS